MKDSIPDDICNTPGCYHEAASHLPIHPSPCRVAFCDCPEFRTDLEEPRFQWVSAPQPEPKLRINPHEMLLNRPDLVDLLYGDEIPFWCIVHRSPAEWGVSGSEDQLNCYWDQLAGPRPGRGVCMFKEAKVVVK